SLCADLPYLEEAREDDGQDRDDAEEEHREHRAGLPVGEARSEEVDDLVAVHVAGGTTDERRRDELAERRDEHEQEGGDDAGRGERQRHAPEGLPAARPEAARRLEQATGEACERNAERPGNDGGRKGGAAAQARGARVGT